MTGSDSVRGHSGKRVPFAKAGTGTRKIARPRPGLDKAAGATRWYQEMLTATILRTSIKLQNHMDRRFRLLCMTAQEAAVLVRIVEARSMTPGGLAHSLARDKGKVSRFIQRLLARNLIRRKVRPRDRRVAELEATSRGRAVASRLKLIFDQLRNDLFRAIPADSVEQVGDILIALLANMENDVPRQKRREQREVPVESGSSKLDSNAHARENSKGVRSANTACNPVVG